MSSIGANIPTGRIAEPHLHPVLIALAAVILQCEPLLAQSNQIPQQGQTIHVDPEPNVLNPNAPGLIFQGAPIQVQPEPNRVNPGNSRIDEGQSIQVQPVPNGLSEPRFRR